MTSTSKVRALDAADMAHPAAESSRTAAKTVRLIDGSKPARLADREHDEQGGERFQGAAGEVGAADFLLFGGMSRKLMIAATEISPLSAAAAPAAALKKFCHVSAA
jgi:hypothetical protein